MHNGGDRTGFFDKVTDIRTGNSNDPEELLERGNLYFDKEDYLEASIWYEKAAELGSSQAEYLLGHMYDLGLGLPENPEKAKGLYERAAAKDHPEAALSLGFHYMFGDGRDAEESFHWMEKAYSLGQMDSAYFIGEALLTGNGVEKDVERGLGYLVEAADVIQEYTEDPEDNYRAPLLLAETYDRGELVERDEDEAVKWYEIAADRDCDEAADRLIELGRREKPEKKGLFGRLRR